MALIIFSLDLHHPTADLPASPSRSVRWASFPGTNLRAWRKQRHKFIVPHRVSDSRPCETGARTIERSAASFGEYASEAELWAAVCLRVRTLYEFRESVGVEDHRRRVAKRAFAALKEKIARETSGYWRVTCLNATLPMSMPLAAAHDLCSVCKFSADGEDRVVVGSLDVHQCSKLPDELAGRKPDEGMGAKITRAYLGNVCVAEELQRNGFGYALISESMKLAKSWGITDLYAHVAVDNEAAKRLYKKSGFIYESEEQAWEARFSGRPRRYLLWSDLTQIGSV